MHSYWSEGTLGHELIPEWNRLRVPEDVSAFTVAELGEMLPATFATMKNEFGEWLCVKGGVVAEGQKACKTEADARAKILIYLIENGPMEARGDGRMSLQDILDKTAMEIALKDAAYIDCLVSRFCIENDVKAAEVELIREHEVGSVKWHVRRRQEAA